MSQCSTSSGPKSSQKYLSVSATQKVSMPFVKLELTCRTSYTHGWYEMAAMQLGWDALMLAKCIDAHGTME